MLTPKTIEIVKATAPILQEHGETLTRHFYKRMFAHNPEVAPFFNPAHQQSGSQQKALASAVCAYAANIDNLGALGGAVELIAQKHVSLQIKPEHYPIVGSNLLASIREVLGEGATDDVINAWAEAYGLLADILIKREAEIYQQQADMPHGWNDFKTFRIIRKERESDIVTSFYLVPENGDAVPEYKAGQYVTVQMPSPCGHTTMRNYSLSDKPNGEYFRISVKRENGADATTPNGYVSNMLHDNANIGDVLSVAAPCGEFYLDSDSNAERPLVFMAGGIGITPIKSMLKQALDTMPKRRIILLYAALHENVQAFRQMLDKLAAQHDNLTICHVYSDAAPHGVVRHPEAVTGVIDSTLLEKFIPDHNADYYFCGPKPFMVSLYRQLTEWNVPLTQIHFEFFGPRQELEKAAA